MAGRCRVEHDVVEVLGAVREQGGELIEGRDLCRAGTRELLAHGSAFGLGGSDAHLRQDALSISLCGVVGVNVQYPQMGSSWNGCRRVAQFN